MPLPGGSADKLGNRYELRWTLHCMIEIMDERADSIRLEPPGAEGEGVEFWLHKGDHREYHQVKRQHSASGRWTLNDLSRQGVLSSFREKLNDSTAWCVFVSTHSAFELKELAERSRSAISSWDEFRKEFLKDDQQSTNFNKLCNYWVDCSPTDVYENLKRIRVEEAGEDFLSATVESRLTTLVEGDSAAVASVLGQFVLDSIHHELTAHDIWLHLEKLGYHRRRWGNDPHVLAAVDDANKRYLEPLREAFIVGKMIPRDESQIALTYLTTPSRKRGVLLAGEAGVGKSSVVFQIIESLHERGMPMLAFRVDRLEPTLLPYKVGEQLGLPGSPVNILASVSAGRDCVLVIDQLDAVSLASGRHAQFFDCINEIIKETQAYSQMRLLLACRKFDLENDHRLRRLVEEGAVAEVVPIHRLSHDTVRGIVNALGLDGARLSQKQLDLLSVPLHLSILAEFAKDSTIDALAFDVAKDLYDRFWEYKQRVIHERIGRTIEWTRVIDTLCDYMSNRQILSAPKEVVDDFMDDADVMASEHVLVLDRERYAFFHEGFFDYAFARRFVAQGGRELGQFLKSGEQHLFRRAQVRQILLHERDLDLDRYLADLNELVTSPQIRFHVKETVFALLADLNDPTEEEWDIVASLLSRDAALAIEVWRILDRSKPWFQLLDSLKLIEKWLADSNAERVDRAIALLSSVQKQVPDRVAELAEPYIGASDAWRNRLAYLVRWADLSLGQRFFNLFLRLIDEGTLDELKSAAINGDFWSFIYSLPAKNPERACEVIGHYLNRRLELSISSGQNNPFDDNTGTIRDSQLDDRIFVESARGTPLKFVEQVLPFMIRVIELTIDKESNRPLEDKVWWYRSYGHGYNIESALLTAMETALGILAAQQPDVFMAYADQLRHLNSETIEYLLIRAYADGGTRFADQAVDYLCQHPECLEVGYIQNSHWASRQLLETITPFCSNDKLTRLESLLLNYYPEGERKSKRYRHFGYAQLVLLEGIAVSRRSPKVRGRLSELYRKFGENAVQPPEPMEVRSVPSPVPDNAADKMSDKQWLKAITKYKTDDVRDRYRRDGRLLGGVSQLSNLLERQTKKQPSRFAELIQNFPDDTHVSYFDAVLRGIADTGLDVDSVLRVCRHCHQLPNRPCGRWICDPISHLAESTLPNEALEVVAWYATEDPNPQEESWRTQTPSGDFYYGGKVLDAGINTVRGRAAQAMGELIFYDGDRIALFLPTLKRMVVDPSIAVRACVANALIGVLRHDRDLAVDLFKQLCETEDVLLKTNYVDHFLYYALQTHFEALEPILHRMLSSEDAEVATTGARQACLASFVVDGARPLVEHCLSGNKPLRMGAAKVFAVNLDKARCRVLCESALLRLFNDSEEEVRSEAAMCFGDLEGEQLGDCIKSVEAFIDSPAFATNPDPLIRALEKTTAKLPDLTCLICERFLDVAGTDAADIRTGRAFDARTVSQLLVRVYSQSKDQAIQSRCLDVIDRMTQMHIYGLHEVFDQFER